MRTEEIIGKNVVDAGGDEIGEVESIEIDWDSKTVKALIVGGKGETAQRIFGRLGVRGSPDIIVPVEDVLALGNVVILSKKASQLG